MGERAFNVATVMSHAEQLAEFDHFYAQTLLPRLSVDFTTSGGSIVKVIERFSRMIDYNVPHGKKLRGVCVVESVRLLVADTNGSCAGRDRPHLIDEASAIGWCIEFLQAAFLVADDIMDNSITRRGKPCWYRTEKVGNIAINDAFYLLSLVYTIIGYFASTHPMHMQLNQLFNQAITNTIVGQGLDLITPPPPPTQPTDLFDFSNYTQDRYDTIVQWKTSYYSFCLPVQCALYVACIDDEAVHRECRRILLAMGHFFQVQDDYLDCYGDPAITGKVGTDIEESKCSWLVVQALAKCNSEQLRTLRESYGRVDAECVKRVKDIFNQLRLQDVYAEFEQRTFADITQSIDELKFEASVPQQAIKAMLHRYAGKIFKRVK